MSQPAYDPHLGRVLGGHYRIDQLLGRGGMGAVYRGLQLSVGRPVAVKLISAGLPNPALSLQRFRREAEATGRLRHPNTIRLFDFGLTDQGEVYMVMELLEGCDLAARLQQHGPLPISEALSILRQVLSALSEAHTLGIVHRDLKPGNVFLSGVHGSDSFVKVMDFGIAGIEAGRDAQKLTMTGAVMGTPAYMSPEQAQGKPVDARSDLYSCGVVLFEMLAGRTPFEAETLVSMLLAHVTEVPQRLETFGVNIPGQAQVQALLDGLLAKSPAHRPASALDVIAFIDSLQGQLQSGAPGAPAMAAASMRTQTRSTTQAGPLTPIAAATPPQPALTPVAWDNPPERVSNKGARKLWIGASVLGALAVALAVGLLLPTPAAPVKQTSTSNATSSAVPHTDKATASATSDHPRQLTTPLTTPGAPTGAATAARETATITAGTARTHTDVDAPAAGAGDTAAETETLADAPTPESTPARAATARVSDHDDVTPRELRARALAARRSARARNRRRAGSAGRPRRAAAQHSDTDGSDLQPDSAESARSARAAPKSAATLPPARAAGAPIGEDVLRRAPPFASIAAAKRAHESGKISTAALEAALSSLKARRARRIAVEQQNLAQGRITAQEYEWRLGRIDQEYRGQ